MTSHAVLKTYFETGDFPTQTQFEELIDAISAPVFFGTHTTVLAAPTASPVAEASFSLAGYVPTGSKAVILEGYADSPSFTFVGIFVRRDTAMPVLCIAGANSIQAGSMDVYAQGVCPLASDLTFRYSGTGAGNVGLKVVGYWT